MPSNTSRRSALAPVLVGLLILATPIRIGADIARAGARTAAPDFSLADANGRTVRLSNLKGKVVLLDFWATWCTGCKVEIPWFMEFQRKYADQGLASIGIAMDEEGWGKVRPYLAEHPISYSIVVGSLDLLQKRFRQAPNLPLTLLVDRRGRIAEVHVGMVDKDAFEHDIQRLLRE